MAAFSHLAFSFLKLNYKETEHLGAKNSTYEGVSLLHAWMASHPQSVCVYLGI